jgi:proteasome alpha subunit
MADMRGYSYDRRDVTGRALASAYAQTLGNLFGESGAKPLEVEICIAEVGTNPAADELYRLTYDGSVQDEPGFLIMGGQAEAIATVVKEKFAEDQPLSQALQLAVKALGSVGGENGAIRTIADDQLEVAVLDRTRRGRAFRRITGNALKTLLAPAATATETVVELPAEPAPDADKPNEEAPGSE